MKEVNTKDKKVLFLCCTPLQIMNAINIKMKLLDEDAIYHYEIDMYILDYSSQNKAIYTKLKKLHLFNNVKYINFIRLQDQLKGNLIKIYMIKAINIVNYKKVYEKHFSKSSVKKIYDEIFAVLPDYALQIIYKYNYKYNANIKVNLYEEGVASYNYFNVIKNRNLLKKNFHNIFFGKKFSNNIKTVYSYRPEYFTNNGNSNIKTIPQIDRNITNEKKLYNYIFGFKYSHLDIEKIKKYIYLNQPWNNTHIEEKEKMLLELILKYELSNNICIKLHPRTGQHMYKNSMNVLNISILLEIIVLNKSFENMVLISLFSTACLNPKIMFDEEPTIIFLFKLVDFSNLPNFDDQVFEVVNQVKKNYRDKSKLLIPETVEELKQMIFKLSK